MSPVYALSSIFPGAIDSQMGFSLTNIKFPNFNQRKDCAVFSSHCYNKEREQLG